MPSKQSNRGGDRGRGGRGGRGGGRGRGRGRRGRGGLGFAALADMDDFALDVRYTSFNGSPSRHGRGPSAHPSGQSTPNRGSRGTGSHRGRGRGDLLSDNLGPKDRMRQKMFSTKLKTSTAPLSQLLYEDRPYLRPIIFVRSEHTPKLFTEEEEIFQPVVEEAGEQEKSHVPTAEQVFRVFSGVAAPSRVPSDTEDLEEIDFEDMGRVALEVELLTVTSMTKTTDTGTTTTSEVQVTEAIVEEKFTGFFIDTKPSPVVDESPAGEIVAHRVGGAAPPLGQSQNDDDDEDVIVYDAPHPRAGRLPSPPPPSAVPAPSFKDVSFSFASTPPTGKRIETNRMKHRRDARHAMFGSFGAIMSEAHLREEDPRRVEQRRGDSDVDWGDPSDGVEDPAVEELSSGLGGMDIDADLDIDAMKAFVKGMSASGSRHLSAGDLADEERMRAEDESQSENRSDRSSDDEGEMAVNADERMMVAELLDGDDDNEEEEEEEEEDEDEEEGEGGDSDGEDSTDDDETPKRGFQARLERLRQRNKGKPVADMLEDELEDDDLDIWSDDDISAQVQKYLDENDDILRGFDRKNRKTFKAIHNGDFSGAFEFPSGPSNRRNDIEGVPMALRDQWSRDRAKKAEAKRKRAQARLEAAADPLAPKRGGTKGRKAMFAAAALDPDIPVPNRVFDAASLEAQIRRFIADIGGRDTMVLPPMAKGARKNVHELALAFGLSSQSKGKGSGRYPMLSKTTRTGFSVNERKVTRILRNMGVTSRGGPGAGGWGGKSGGSGMVAKPRDGEVVGKAAPKIGSSNVGFQMLAAMGWSQGDRIGITGGIEVPLTAIVKNTKLGLGAS